MSADIRQVSTHINLAIIGCGEVGRCYATTFAQSVRFTLSLCDVRPSAAAFELAKKIGTTIHDAPGSWLDEADLVISCVVGAAALDVAQAAMPHMKGGAAFADFSTAAPASKRAAAALAQSRNILFADVAILGAIGLDGVQAQLLCAGDGVALLKQNMAEIGAPCSVLADGVAGDAVTLKLVRSIFTKGLEALTVECLVAAEALGVRQELYDILSDFNRKPLRQRMDNYLRTHVIHACRRLHEVAEAEQQVRSAGLPVLVLPGVKALFAQTCESLDAEPIKDTPNADEALAWLLQSSLNRTKNVPPTVVQHG